ncbi:Minor capsid [Clostridium carnis]|uniref:Minor capsid n=1 Tax=Clostridium carnis TaxID=1530 RepID=A0ABY6T0V7_9CLOT|nr:minor capsid protein [Clostridium carnis]VDG74707.1 Minor capsid [Clostridium carnis]
MSDVIKIQMNSAQQILLKRYLNKDGAAQVKFTRECAKIFNNYVPFKTGRLKEIDVKVETARIIYSAPYAKKQYNTNEGNGLQGVNNGGLRGKQWDKRSWSSHGDGVVQTIAEFVGGRAK